MGTQARQYRLYVGHLILSGVYHHDRLCRVSRRNLENANHSQSREQRHAAENDTSAAAYDLKYFANIKPIAWADGRGLARPATEWTGTITARTFGRLSSKRHGD